MTKNSFRFIHVDQDFSLSGTDIKPGTPAYAHAAVMRALMRIRAVCNEEILSQIPGIDRELSAMVLTQHELYSRLVLVDPESIDEDSIEKQLIDLRMQHLPPHIAGTNPSQRIFPRYKTKINFQLTNKGKVIDASSTNISLDGLCADFKQADQVIPGEEFDLSLVGKTRQLSMKAHIAWSFNNHNGSVAGVALKFNDANCVIDWIKFILSLHLRNFPLQSLN